MDNIKLNTKEFLDDFNNEIKNTLPTLQIDEAVKIINHLKMLT